MSKGSGRIRNYRVAGAVTSLAWAAALLIGVGPGTTGSHSPLSVASARAQAGTNDEAHPATVDIAVDSAAVLRKFNPRRLGGTNVALWNDAAAYEDPEVLQWISDLKPALIRIPGGSWSNSVYWNGNGVRGKDGKVDPSKVGPDGYPAVDYSAYAPSFTVDAATLRPSTGFSGHVDVKTQHEWIRKVPGAEPMVCLNAGTGRPIDAAEWVKWANFTTPNHARYWEIGNELDGSWEPGYFLPDGSKITAEIYAGRYNAIASAMKAVDPSIKVGGCAFPEAMIRSGGTNVDFVSIHTYPGRLTLTPQENLKAVPKIVSKEVSRVRDWIRKYQPTRESSIEVAYTEWNLAGGQNASDLFSGLWACTFLAEATRNGVDFTTQWDVFTHSKGMKTGHGLLFADGHKYIRKPSYYAMQMWNNRTGDRLVESTGTDDSVYHFASIDDHSTYVMLINQDDTQAKDVRLTVKGANTPATAEAITLSARNYFWNPLTSYPEWSVPPKAKPVSVDSGKVTLTLPPFSATFVTISSQAGTPAQPHTAETPTSATPATDKTTLRIVVPTTVYEGDDTIGWLQAVERATPTTRPTPIAGLTARMSADNAATFKSPDVDLSEAVGTFSFRPNRTGPLTLRAKAGDAETSVTLQVKSSEPRPRVFWDFTDSTLTSDKLFASDFKLGTDGSMRANKFVPRVDLPAEGIIPTEKGNRRTLLRVNRLPDAASLTRDNIRGVVFDIRTVDLHTDDPSASVQVIMQSTSNYWMVLGSVPLKNLGDKWSTKTVITRDANLLKAVPSSFNLWFVLGSSKPVKGAVCFDRIGFMAR